MARYILELEPFKSLPVAQVAETIAPNLQRYLTGALPEFHLAAKSNANPDPDPER